MPEMPPLLALRRLHKAFGDKQVLRGLSLEVGRGESVVLIGGSGVGKSVTIKIALGLMRADAGEIVIDGASLAAMSGAERATALARFGMLFQGGALFDSLRVWENVAFRLIYREHVNRRAAKAQAIEALAKVRLGPDVAELYPANLSGGMQKRTALARAILGRPDLIFFDEPTTGLDPITADAINALISSLVRDLGCAALTITHDLASARKIADRVAMIHDGRILWEGRPALLNASGDPFVDQFVHGRADGPIQPNL
ncbi:MAG TPA: ABC transporter ATP-binding protein [Hyphomonadaceae bacterium]|nr:ABC transporter ATP-binding protein [Hyphomonadaceae bacterium]